jgi:DNA modification methylase
MTDFWTSTLEETVRTSGRLARGPKRVRDVKDWLNCSEEGPTSTAQGTSNVPFQRWFHFKEAYSPKFVADTLGALPYKVGTCLDPFGGSGTTAVTCRMLGIGSTTIEINPYLADLTRAKLTPIGAAAFRRAYERKIASLRVKKVDWKVPSGMPLTMMEPGIDGRFVFPRDVFSTVRAIARVSENLDKAEARLLRVLLGSVLVANSNVVINGKGRRYRSRWEERQKQGEDLISALDCAVDTAVADLTMYGGLPRGQHRVLQGDTRTALSKVSSADVAIFSPPYPNSFDYTDVYNLELWMLGYLNSGSDNMALRKRTLRSHVQTKWHKTPRKAQSAKLDIVVKQLAKRRQELWNPNIPEMVAFYFDDLYKVFQELRRILAVGHHAIVAIGDSQYAGILIDVGAILVESIRPLGFRLTKRGAIRSMRNSSQHGGSFKLFEHCLVFERI